MKSFIKFYRKWFKRDFLSRAVGKFTGV